MLWRYQGKCYAVRRLGRWRVTGFPDPWRSSKIVTMSTWLNRGGLPRVEVIHYLHAIFINDIHTFFHYLYTRISLITHTFTLVIQKVTLYSVNYLFCNSSSIILLIKNSFYFFVGLWMHYKVMHNKISKFQLVSKFFVKYIVTVNHCRKAFFFFLTDCIYNIICETRQLEHIIVNSVLLIRNKKVNFTYKWDFGDLVSLIL